MRNLWVCGAVLQCLLFVYCDMHVTLLLGLFMLVQLLDYQTIVWVELYWSASYSISGGAIMSHAWLHVDPGSVVSQRVLPDF